MASNNVRVGGARVDFSAQDAQYQAVVRRVQNQNERLARSYTQIGRGAQRQSRFVGQLTGIVAIFRGQLGSLHRRFANIKSPCGW